jgi:type 1 glutamine amidotransferase
MKTTPALRLACLCIATILFVALPCHALAAEPLRVLVFSKTLMYRHASITNGIAMLKKLAAENQFAVDATEASSVFTPENLARYKAIVFLSTSGDVLNDGQQDAFKDFIETGGGLVAIHAGVAGEVATEGTWPWYVEMFCTDFANHKAIERATVHVEDRTNASTAHLPGEWSRVDEWYNFNRSPRGQVHVLASLDEKSFHGGTMGGDHPVAWCKRIGRGRLWYTALGHTAASYTEPEFVQHVLGGIHIAAGLKPADFTPNDAPASRTNGQ